MRDIGTAGSATAVAAAVVDASAACWSAPAPFATCSEGCEANSFEDNSFSFPVSTRHSLFVNPTTGLRCALLVDCLQTNIECGKAAGIQIAQQRV